MEPVAVETTSDQPEIKVSDDHEVESVTSDIEDRGEAGLPSDSPGPPTEEPLLRGVMLMCPWCGNWQHVEAYTQLQIPPNFPKQSAPIYKCSGEDGCKQLFSVVG